MKIRTHLLVPIALSGLLLSASQGAFASRELSPARLERLENRLERIQTNRQLRADWHAARVNQRIPIVQNTTVGLGNLPSTASFQSHSNVARQLRHSLQLNENQRWRNIGNNLDLDLSSAKSTITLGGDLFDSAQSVTIRVGGTDRVLVTGATVTPAEFVALTQVLDGGKQHLILSSDGVAVDGSFSLSNISDANGRANASSLIVPASVEAMGNFGRGGDLQIRDDLVNYGSIIASAKASGKVVFSADNIINHENALISTVSLSHKNQTDLELNARNEFTNLGDIISSGTLKIQSGTGITNSAVQSKISAVGDISLSSTKQVNNGSITSANGNINFGTAVPSAIEIQNTGTIAASNGAINIRANDFAEKFDTTLTGGNWQSKELNLNGGDGLLNVNAGTISGAVNARAGIAHINADTNRLYIKNLSASGDPTISNSGDILQGSISTGGGPLTIVAGGNIQLASLASLDTSNAGGTAGDITLVAGALFEPASDPDHPGQLWITGATANGGSILSDSKSAYSIKANGDVGGNIQLVALGANGTVQLPNTLIEAKGDVGNNGNLSVLASKSISLLSVTLKGDGATSTGNALISALAPTIVGGKVVVDDASGSILSGSFASGVSGAGGSVTVSQLRAGNDVDIRTGTTSATSANVGVYANHVSVVTGSGASKVSGSFSSLDFKGSGDLETYDDLDLNIQTFVLNGVNSNGIIHTTGKLTTPGALSVNHLELFGKSLVLGGDISTTKKLVLDSTDDLIITNKLHSGEELELMSHNGIVDVRSEITGLDFSLGGLDIKISGSVVTNDPLAASTLTLTGYNNLVSDGITGKLDVSSLTLLAPGGSIGLSESKPFVLPAISGIPALGLPGTLSATSTTGTIIYNPHSNIVIGKVDGGGLILVSENAVSVVGDISTSSIAITAKTGDINVTGKLFASTTGINLTSTAGSVIDSSDIYGQQISISALDEINLSGTIKRFNGSLPSLKLQTSGDLLSDGLTGTFEVNNLELVSLNGNIGNSSDDRFVFNGLTNIVGSGHLALKADKGSAWVFMVNGGTEGGANLESAKVNGDLNLKVNGQLTTSVFTLIESTTGNITLESGDMMYIAPGSIVRAPNDVSLKSGTGKDIFVQGTIEANRLRVDIDYGGFLQPGGTANISESKVNFFAGTGTGGVKLNNNNGDITVESLSEGNSTVNTSGVLTTLDALSAYSIELGASNFNLGGSLKGERFIGLTDTAGDFSLDRSIDSGIVSLSAQGNIYINQSIMSSETNTVSSLSITTENNLNSDVFNAFVQMHRINLTSNNGNIGTSITDRFLLNNAAFEDGTPLLLNLFASNGSAFVESVNQVSLLDSTTQGALNLLSRSSASIDADQRITAMNGDITIVGTKGAFEIGKGAFVTAKNGNVFLQNLGEDRKHSSFAVGDDVTIKASSTTAGSGNVTLAMGTIPTRLKDGRNFNKKVITASETNGGKIIWGNKKWQASTAPVLVNANGAIVLFSTSSSRKNSSLGKNVQITAEKI